MNYIMVDIKSDAPIPGEYSFGAVIVGNHLQGTFSGLTTAMSKRWGPNSLAISGLTREQTLNINDPEETMLEFDDWMTENSVDDALRSAEY
jgi:hypothetical protein